MKKSRLIPTLALIVLFLTSLAFSAQAQGPTDLSELTIKLWPEYDDPRLLVIIDGRLATPGSEVRLPVPQEAKLNAVATSDGSGRLLKNEWREETGDDGSRIIVLTPQNPAFRIEYYTPMGPDGDQRVIDFELPAGYLNAEQAVIEALLPPSSTDVTLEPPSEESGPTQGEAHLYRRTLGAVKNQAITQKVTYANPSGALTVPETAPTTAETSGAAPAVPQQPSTPASAKSGLNPWIILLGVAALLLIVGGAVGLWWTSREPEPEPAPVAPAPRGRKKKKGSVQVQAAGNWDRYCRNCGEEFGPDDRFCRYCGAPRQKL